MLKSKIKSLQELKKIIATLKAKGKRIVFTNGCFDLLHYGHVKYLEETKQKGDILVVAVNSDTSIKRIKGDKKPIVKEEDRLGVIAALESVDYVVKFNEDTPLETIKILRPDILVKGSDWLKNRIVGSDFVQGYGGKVLTVQLVSGRSTTDLIRKIVKVFAKKKH
jgi:D-beta-D-heptose 7-phosphate kinase/D-beta-D-heptose 1-phosphate adenosyltransferase